MEPFQRRGGVDSCPGLQAGQRVDLDEVDLAVLGDAEVDASEVAAPERTIGLARHVLRPLQDVPRELRGRAHVHRLVVHRFQVIVVDAVAPLGKLRLVDDVLDRGEDALPLRRRLLQEGDGEVLAGNELLDEDSGGEPGERLLHQGTQPGALLDHGILRDPLRATLEVGLHDEGKAPAVELEIGEVGDELPARRDDAVLGEHQLGERLVEGDGEHPGVGAGIGKSELVEECGIESLAKPAPPALGGVEDQLRGVGLDARRRPRGGAAHLDALDAMAEPLESGGECVDGFAGIEFGFVFGIGQAQIVRQGDAHASS